ncbi:diguanylate cyclase (GGDEF)-like protein [Kushneria sinocarnis]|uniref:diguanylate cyclase n=1 Tax=Kushneria sinocarnis TaxID=595502 RepID=A0A420WZP3_9GAMM|nr:diguanylate cyclase [Kushneria sinocarnis]RKR06813.1 diguanylate cyclase (GGDEF)-like protein [Kushneria sinocarnis]
MLSSSSLRAQFIITLALTFLVMLIVLGGVFYQLMMPGLVREEQQHARLHISNIQRAVEQQIEKLSSMTHQWASWDSTHDFMLGEQADYPRTHITRRIFESDGISLLLLTDATDGVSWVAAIDPLSGRLTSCPEATGRCAWMRPLVRALQRSLPHTTPAGSPGHNRMLAVPDFTLASSWPITRDDGTGPMAGHLTLARHLPSIWSLGSIDGMPVVLTLRAVRDPAARPERTRQSSYIEKLDEDSLLLSMSRPTSNPDHRLLLQTRLPRDRFRAGLEDYYRVMLGVFGLLLVTLIIALCLFHRLVLQPIVSLSRYAKRLRHNSESLEMPPSWLQARQDELGLMAREFQHLITDLDERNTHLEALVELDALTGLGNRRLLDRRLPQILSLTHRLDRPVALIMIDVDHFKAFNDYYGHPEGDECLKILAATLSDIFQRDSDLIARIGGEEFVVVLPDFDVDEARNIASGVRTAIEAQCIEHARSPTSHYVTISAGVAVSHPHHPLAAAALLKQADLALYRIKRDGRNSVGYCDDGEPSASTEDESLSDG